ncbi:aminopeptidase [Sporolactobacillus laevolacticus]|uniref:Peptidase M29 n=1 Tax=Sporolactobacillus laevolacticus DSM 442 TaxID=1395513 RepID=V6J1R7_9BACL|nr:aminopeptidase [Sporolactobacillus laevolacticus]EST10689.1 peptidase M29 [Sporolactobacillus laevolacticus DSM 442]
MENFETLLDHYADITVTIGLNVQKDQDVMIFAPIESPEFVRKIVKKAYEVGAKNVFVDWTDEQLTRLRLELAAEQSLEQFPDWRAKSFQELADQNAAFLYIYSPNPELLKGIDPLRISAAQKAAAAANKQFTKDKSSAKVSWTIVSVPTLAWSAKVYPGMGEAERMDALWQQIFTITRANNANPEEAWKKHIQALTDKLNYFNEKRFKKLHYNGPGTNLTIELPTEHLWVGGGMTNGKGTPFQPNMPTEEIFTMPLKTGVNGTVSSTKPLNYGGNLIDHFSITFENGRIVDYTAKQGLDTLKQIIETDEGAHYLGEVSLVPHHSPISETNLIFYNTLFDENASCHLAIGHGFPFNYRGGRQMSEEALAAAGMNQSLTHVDFMVGSGELDIDGETADGQIIPIFREGNWVI